MVKLLFAFLIVSPFGVFSQGNAGNSEFKSIEFNSSTQIVEKSLPPLLELSSVIFLDANHNNRLDANETASINFYIVNKGKGMAKNVKINTTNGTTLITGFSWDQAKTVALIPAGDSAKVAVNLQSNLDLKTGALTLNLNFNEPMGFAPDPLELIIQTKEFNKPNVIVVDQKVVTANGKVGKKQNTILKVLVQNIGQGAAENVNVNFVLPSQGNVNGLGEYNFVFPILEPFEQKEINFEFIISDKYSSKSVPITISISEKYNRFAQGKTCDIAINSITSTPPPVTPQPTGGGEPDRNKGGSIGSLTSDVDKDIPVNTVKNPNRYALVIGNENYSSRNSGLNSESNVAFAEVDASVFAQYAVNTLGVPKENLQLLVNATGGEINSQIKRFTKLLNLTNGSGEFIFFYAGHGLPEEGTNVPYIVPVDGNYGNLAESGINLYEMYNDFTSTNASKVIVFMDACFSGGARDAGLVAARAVKIKPKKGDLKGNIVVYTATSAEQAAMPYTEKRHGLFTYFLLKKLKESNGKLTLGELGDYISNNVAKQSLLVNQKEQAPEIIISEELIDTWRTQKIINY